MLLISPTFTNWWYCIALQCVAATHYFIYNVKQCELVIKYLKFIKSFTINVFYNTGHSKCRIVYSCVTHIKNKITLLLKKLIAVSEQL